MQGWLSDYHDIIGMDTTLEVHGRDHFPNVYPFQLM